MNKKRSALRTKTTEQEIGCKRPDHSTNTQKTPNVPHTFQTMRSRTGVQRRGNITCDIARSDRLLNRRARKEPLISEGLRTVAAGELSQNHSRRKQIQSRNQTEGSIAQCSSPLSACSLNHAAFAFPCAASIVKSTFEQKRAKS